MHTPLTKKTHYQQGILGVTPDGKAPHNPITFSAGSNLTLAAGGLPVDQERVLAGRDRVDQTTQPAGELPEIDLRASIYTSAR